MYLNQRKRILVVETSVQAVEEKDVGPSNSSTSNAISSPKKNNFRWSSAQEAATANFTPSSDGSDLEYQGQSDVTKSQEGEKKSKALRKRQVPPVMTSEPPEEESSSDEDEVPIRYLVFCIFHLIISFLIRFFFNFNLRRIPVAKTNCHTLPGSDSIGSGSPSRGIQGNENQSLPYTVKQINGMKKFECNVCTKTFNHLSNINRHIVLIHTGERPFKCKFCNKRFTRKSGLKDHVRTHTGERPFSCTVCGKRFKQNSYLKSHMRIHTGEKFACDICQKRFSRRNYLKLHKQRRHINERPYKCGGCKMKYINANRLRNHWKRSNCEPSSIEESSPTDLISSEVQGNNFINL